ncbi:hypothetical protein EVA_02076 [gut metagenome]|uniref:Uncharacterized protein n=1 Tax=gut metagenome TaxID=749906 RepID=J9GNU3_9ZZZZ
MVLDFLGCGEDIALVHIGHDDDEFEVAVFKFFEGFFFSSHLGEAGWVA